MSKTVRVTRRVAAILDDIRKHWQTTDRLPTDLQYCTCLGCQVAGFVSDKLIDHAADWLRDIAEDDV